MGHLMPLKTVKIFGKRNVKKTVYSVVKILSKRTWERTVMHNTWALIYASM